MVASLVIPNPAEGLSEVFLGAAPRDRRLEMSIINCLKSWFSNRAKAMSLYRRGMARAQQQDPQGALTDYNAILEMPRGPSDVKAMALFNRALVYAADGDEEKAIGDLQLVLAMAGAPPDVKTEARRKLERMKRQASKLALSPPPSNLSLGNK